MFFYFISAQNRVFKIIVFVIVNVNVKVENSQRQGYRFRFFSSFRRFSESYPP